MNMVCGLMPKSHRRRGFCRSVVLVKAVAKDFEFFTCSFRKWRERQRVCR